MFVSSKWFLTPAQYGTVQERFQNPIGNRFIIEGQNGELNAFALRRILQIFMGFPKDGIGDCVKIYVPFIKLLFNLRGGRLDRHGTLAYLAEADCP